MTTARTTTAALLLLLTATVPPARGLPEVPAVDRDVALVRSAEFTYPHIPPLRTTADGRIGISPKPIDGMVRFYVLVPEIFTAPFVDSPSGDHILAELTHYEVPESEFRGPDDILLRHYALCDPTAEFHSTGELTSPYACGTDGRDDCYDFVVITSTGIGHHAIRNRRLWGTTVTVRVSSPKTDDAAIAQVTAATPRTGPIFRAGHFFEPTTTNDGRLLTGRVDTRDFPWVHPEENRERNQYADLVYSFNRTGKPCDVGEWKNFYPISHAPYDAAVNSRYGFAMHPFRDATGTILPDGDDLGVSYPWLDRKGRNLFFTSIGATLAITGVLPAGEDSATRYPTRCVPDTECDSRTEWYTRRRGQGVVGLWTRGKMVVFDGILNNTDYGLELDDRGHRLVQLYRDGSGPRGYESGEVRIGTGQDGADSRGPATYIRNSAVVDSLENSFNALPHLRPATPADVTWIINSGKASDEIAFDDWIDLDAFIVSEMVGATAYRGVVEGAGVIDYYDGWRDGAFRDPVRIQNAATALPDRWRVPPAGIAHGDVRLEPVALGGVRGKGLWLDGQSGLTYEIAEQRVDMDDMPWYLGLFLDSRFPDDDTERTLIGFADGSRIVLRGRGSLLYSGSGGTVLHRIDLVDPLPHGSWTHLGFQLLAGGAGVVFHRDGFALDHTPDDSPAGLRVSPGSLFVGRDPRNPGAGVRGWIDEFVVIARDLEPEPACNQAAGTLAALAADAAPATPANRTWDETARLYPAWAHERIRVQLAEHNPAAEERYVCYHGYRRDHENHLGNMPSHLRSVRRELTFPEGPLKYGEPRPDSSSNSFCLSCHSAQDKGGLTTGALVRSNGQPMEDDPRRQPSQPLRRVFGNVPAGWLGNGKPSLHTVAPAAGLKVDALLAGVIHPVETHGPSPAPCAGDCDLNGIVAIDELIVATRIALGSSPFGSCRRAFDCSPTSTCVTIAQLTRAVRNARDGCSPTARNSR